MQLGILESREEETILAAGVLLKMLRNEAQCSTKNISLPGQFNLSSFSGKGGKLLWVSHRTNQGTLLGEVLIIKVPNSEQSEKSQAEPMCISPKTFSLY